MTKVNSAKISKNGAVTCRIDAKMKAFES